LEESKKLVIGRENRIAGGDWRKIEKLSGIGGENFKTGRDWRKIEKLSGIGGKWKNWKIWLV
jgi:hypothetical protein